MKIERYTFTQQEIRMDGVEFVDCTFVNCTLVYAGGPPPSIVNCTFDSINWSFTESAGNTIQFLGAIYQGFGEGGQELVEQLFENIRTLAKQPEDTMN